MFRGQTIPLHIPEDLEDDMTNTTRGYSWLDNAKFTEKPYPLLELIMEDPDQTLCWKDREGNFHFHAKGANEFMQDASDINKDLSVLDHTAHGQPHRGTEFVDSKIRNSWRRRNGIRNLGRLYWVEQYSKKTNGKQMDTFVPVAVSEKVQEVEEKYLLLIRPVEELIARELWGEEARVLYHEYMYVDMGTRVTPDQFSRRLGRYMKRLVGFPVATLEWRHLAVAITREFIPVQYHRNFKANSIGDLIMDHLTDTAQGIYAGLEGDLPYLTTDAMFKFNDFCAQWQCVTGFGKHPPPLPLRLAHTQTPPGPYIPAGQVGPVAPPAGGDVMQMLQAVMDKMNSLEATMTTQNARVSSTLQEFRVQTKEDIRQGLAECFATFNPRQAEQPASVQHQASIPEPPPDIPTRPDSPLEYSEPMSETILKAIRHLLGNPEAQIRSEGQLRSIEAALQLQSNLVSVMATGEGKSMIWQTCAYLQPGVRNVVVVPSAANLSEQFSRAEKMGLKPLHFKFGGRTPQEHHFGESNLVFVAMETAADRRFERYVGTSPPMRHQLTVCHPSLCRSQGVKRIFFDEGHELLVSQDFRERWSGVYTLATSQSWQRVYLTATLPPVLQDSWYQMAGIDPQKTILIRGPTNRKELGYHIVRVNPKQRQRDSVLEKMVRMLEVRFSDPEARRIIFTASKEDCNSTAERLGCFKHHSGMSRDDREKQLEAWKEGVMTSAEGSHRKETWIAATPGLITGYDYHRVDGVIFFEMGYGLLNVVQGGGRAGRDRREGFVFVLTSDNHSTAHRYLKEDPQLRGKLVEWLEDKEGCLRMIISDTMDGRKVNCIDLPDCNPCGRCNPDSDAAQLVRKAIRSADAPKKASIPMGDIQELLSKASNTQAWDESMEDMDLDTDELMASMDLGSVAASSTAVSATSSWESITPLVPRKQQPPIQRGKPSLNPSGPGRSGAPQQPLQPPRHKPPTLRPAPNIGMSIRLNGAQNSNMQEVKLNKSTVLNKLATTLRGCCRTCWTWKNRLVRDPGHKEFLDCWKQQFCGDKLTPSIGAGSFKRLVDMKKWHFCFHCGLPQDVDHIKYRPECHPVPGGGQCDFAGLSWYILYTLHQCPALWSKVKEVFQLGEELDDMHAFAAWCSSYDPRSSNYWMGLELVLWFWGEREKGRFLNVA